MLLSGLSKLLIAKFVMFYFKVIYIIYNVCTDIFGSDSLWSGFVNSPGISRVQQTVAQLQEASITEATGNLNALFSTFVHPVILLIILEFHIDKIQHGYIFCKFKTYSF